MISISLISPIISNGNVFQLLLTLFLMLLLFFQNRLPLEEKLFGSLPEGTGFPNLYERR